MNYNLDQYSRAKELIKSLGCLPDKEEKNKFHSVKDGCIVLHPGASEEARSWPDSYWFELVCLLIPKFKVSVVVTRESFDLVESLRKKGLNLEYFEGSLVDFSQYINFQKCLIAPRFNGWASIKLFWYPSDIIIWISRSKFNKTEK